MTARNEPQPGAPRPSGSSGAVVRPCAEGAVVVVRSIIAGPARPEGGPAHERDKGEGRSKNGGDALGGMGLRAPHRRNRDAGTRVVRIDETRPGAIRDLGGNGRQDAPGHEAPASGSLQVGRLWTRHPTRTTAPSRLMGAALECARGVRPANESYGPPCRPGTRWFGGPSRSRRLAWPAGPASGDVAVGIWRRNVAPFPGPALLHQTVPPCASAIPLLM